MTAATLTDRVRATLSREQDGEVGWASRLLDRVPGARRVTDRERDLMEWGLVYGLAYGLLVAERGDDADLRQLGEDALLAARQAWATWSDPIAPRVSMSPIVDDALVAFEKAESPIMGAVYDRRMTEADKEKVKTFVERVNDVWRAVGVPEEVAA